jgi:hypothetical protein
LRGQIASGSRGQKPVIRADPPAGKRFDGFQLAVISRRAINCDNLIWGEIQMAPIAVDAQRFDPYKNFTLRLRDGSRTYSGNVRTGLFPAPEAVYRQTSDDPLSPRKLTGLNKYDDIALKRGFVPDTGFSAWASQAGGQSKYEPVSLERGVTHDAGFAAWTSQPAGPTKYEPVTLERGVTHDTTFSNWASQVWDFGSGMGSEVSPANFRRDIFLEFYNETGQLVVRYRIYGTNVSETPVLPPGGLSHHFLHPRGHRSIQEQLAVIFQNSLRRYRP